MKRASAWQWPQTCMICSPLGLPIKPLAGSIAVIPGSLASPPWQATQPKPRFEWISDGNSFTGFPSRSSPKFWWHPTQLSSCSLTSAPHTRTASTDKTKQVINDRRLILIARFLRHLQERNQVGHLLGRQRGPLEVFLLRRCNHGKVIP